MTATASMSTDLLGIFAKHPSPGHAKTRLAHASSADWARRVAEALLDDTLERFAGWRGNRTIAFTPANAADRFAPCRSQGYQLVSQCDGDLGDRLRHFFQHHRCRGFARIVVIGTDSPTMPIALIDQAFEALAAHDVVIGPSLDGGYYLIGSQSDDTSFFDRIPWSTAKVLETTAERVRSAGARLALLPPWYDVDTLDDWMMLRGHVLALRQAGIDPGVPRLERLIQEENS